MKATELKTWSHWPRNAGYGLPLAQGDRDCGEDQRAGKCERRRVTGADADPRRGCGYVIEDDYDSEFRYDKEPVGALQGLAPDQVFLLGTASKALAPAVRLGWVHAPSPLASAVAAEKEMSDRGSCTLDQLALATLLTTGRYDRHLRRMRTVYAARRTALTDAFARQAPRVQLTGLAAGFHAVAPLPPGADETAVIAAARDGGSGCTASAPTAATLTPRRHPRW